MRLRIRHTVATEGTLPTRADEVMSDGVGPGVVTAGEELLSQLEDLGLDVGRRLLGAGTGPV